MILRFDQSSAAPEASFRHGVKKPDGASVVKQRAVRTNPIYRHRRKLRHGSTDDLPGHKGDTHSNMGSGSLWKKKPVYHARVAMWGYSLEGAG